MKENLKWGSAMFEAIVGLVSLIFIIPSYILGVFFAAAKSGFLAGVMKFEGYVEQAIEEHKE